MVNGNSVLVCDSGGYEFVWDEASKGEIVGYVVFSIQVGSCSEGSCSCCCNFDDCLSLSNAGADILVLEHLRDMLSVLLSFVYSERQLSLSRNQGVQRNEDKASHEATGKVSHVLQDRPT